MALLATLLCRPHYTTPKPWQNINMPTKLMSSNEGDSLTHWLMT